MQPRPLLSVQNSFVPRGNDHAIRQVELGLGFLQPLSPRVLELFRHPSGGRLESDFPRIEVFESRLLNLQIDPKEGFQSAAEQPGSVEKVELKQFSKAGLLDWQVGIEKNRIYVACYAYSRWREVADLAGEYLGEVFSRVQPEVAIANSIVCHVVDEFFSTAQAGEKIDELLIATSDIISHRAVKSDGLFHSNCGWFENIDDTSRRLVKVDLASLPLEQFSGVREDANYGVRIDIFQRTDALGHPFSLSMASDGPIRRAFEVMHVRNKELVTDLLQPEMRTRIGLVP